MNKEPSAMKKLISNIFYLLFGTVTTKVVSAVAALLYARHVGDVVSGELGVVMAFSVIAVFCTDSGISQTSIREGTKPNANISSIMYSYIRARIFLFVIVTFFATILVLSIYNSADSYAILLFTVPTLLGALLQGVGTTYFQIIERMQFVSFINVIASIGSSAVLISAVFLNLSFYQVLFFYGLSTIIAGLFSVYFVLKRIKLEKELNNKIYHQFLTFTVNGLIIMLIPQLGPIILERVLSKAAVGNYSQAFRIPAILYQFPAIIATAFYPKLFALGAEGNFVEHRKTSAMELKIMGTLGMILAIPFILAPEFWIHTLLGKQFLKAIPALVILSYLVFTQAVKFPLSDYLTTVGKQLHRTIIMTVGLVVAVLGYIILGSFFGIAGAAFAPILSDLVIIFGCVLIIPKGFAFLMNNIFILLLGFVISFISYKILFIGLHPLIGITLAEIIFIVITVIGYKELREAIVQFMKRRSLKS